jgi:hypothetical protein
MASGGAITFFPVLVSELGLGNPYSRWREFDKGIFSNSGNRIS